MGNTNKKRKKVDVDQFVDVDRDRWEPARCSECGRRITCRGIPNSKCTCEIMHDNEIARRESENLERLEEKIQEVRTTQVESFWYSVPKIENPELLKFICEGKRGICRCYGSKCKRKIKFYSTIWNAKECMVHRLGDESILGLGVHRSRFRLDDHFVRECGKIFRFDHPNILKFRAVTDVKNKDFLESEKIKVELVSERCDYNLETFFEKFPCFGYIGVAPYYDKITFPQVNFEDFPKVYQDFLISVHFAFNHPTCEFSVIPSDVLCHRIIPFVSKESVLSERMFEVVAKIIFEIGKGMLYLHKQEYVMGELQPKDIFIKKYPVPTDEIEVKIGCNFHLTFGDYCAEQRTYSLYTAPEIITPQVIPYLENHKLPFHEKFNCKSDVFSFAILMYLCLSGSVLKNNRAFYEKSETFRSFIVNNGDSEETAMRKTLEKVSIDGNCRPDFEKLPNDILRSVPDWYKNLCEMCWVMQPLKRPSFEGVLNIFKNVNNRILDSCKSSSRRSDDDDSTTTTDEDSN